MEGDCYNREFCIDTLLLTGLTVKDDTLMLLLSVHA